MDTNFLPNTKCPHCGANIVVAISGFGSELNTREKFCNKCNRPFFVHILVQTTLHKEVVDGEINSYKSRIKFLNKQRRKSLTEQLVSYEIAQEINREALKMATEMRRKMDLN
jgi:ribosomal protein S27AE